MIPAPKPSNLNRRASKKQPPRHGRPTSPKLKCRDNFTIAADWPGIQLYYPPVKYDPAVARYETLEEAVARFRKHADASDAHTLIFDLEDGCRQKALSRELLRSELPKINRDHSKSIAIRVNSFGSEEYRLDLEMITELAEFIDVVMLAKAGEFFGAAEIRDLASELAELPGPISIQPIVEHPKSLKIATELMQYPQVHHVVFGIHDFSKAMGMQITPENWLDELGYFLNQLLFEARLAGKGVIGGVETLIGTARPPRRIVEPDEVKIWLDQDGDIESRIVYSHAKRETAMGLTGKQVIHPGHVHLCKVAYTPSPGQIARQMRILTAGAAADAFAGGAIRIEDQMFDPPMFGKALQVLLRAYALNVLDAGQVEFVNRTMEKMPVTIIRENWPYGAIL